MTYSCCHLIVFALLAAVASRVALSCTFIPVETRHPRNFLIDTKTLLSGGEGSRTPVQE